VVERGKGQSRRLERQHELAGGPLGIFGEEAKKHDAGIRGAVELVLKALIQSHPSLEFSFRNSIGKDEISQSLRKINKDLGKVLFVNHARIKPDGGIIEVRDKHGKNRILLVGESKHQGNDIEKISAGIKQGKNKDADLMVAGNAIERVHKNILEFRNLMMNEIHFPYVVFLQGSNFATETFHVKSPDGRSVLIGHDDGSLNRIDRVTSSSFGMDINTNYCRNKFVNLTGNKQMLQAASLYFQANRWTMAQMVDIMWDIVGTSLAVLKDDL